MPTDFGSGFVGGGLPFRARILNLCLATRICVLCMVRAIKEKKELVCHSPG